MGRGGVLSNDAGVLTASLTSNKAGCTGTTTVSHTVSDWQSAVYGDSETVGYPTYMIGAYGDNDGGTNAALTRMVVTRTNKPRSLHRVPVVKQRIQRMKCARATAVSRVLPNEVRANWSGTLPYGVRANWAKICPTWSQRGRTPSPELVPVLVDVLVEVRASWATIDAPRGARQCARAARVARISAVDRVDRRARPLALDARAAISSSLES